MPRPSSSTNPTSMVPLIDHSDRPVIRKSKKINTNDIVAFNKWNKIVAHRLIYSHPQKNYLITKGDNNLKADGKIKSTQALGKVEEIVRNGQRIQISHLYLSQSINYLNQLVKINKSLRNKKVPYVVLKGLPLHLHFSEEPPKRLYLDADALVRKKDLQRVSRVLKQLGFRKLEIKLFDKAGTASSQISYVKKTEPFPVVIDLHLEPAIAFTKVREMNKLLTKTRQFTNHLFGNIRKVRVENKSFPILKTETLVLYLLLHFYHHNFNGIHRLELINTIIRKKKISWNNLGNTIKNFEFENLIYPGILMLRKYYNTEIPEKFLKQTHPSPLSRLLGLIALRLISPFNRSTRTIEGMKRFLFLLLLSPATILQKTKVVFKKETFSYFVLSIKSLFISADTKASKSFFA